MYGYATRTSKNRHYKLSLFVLFISYWSSTPAAQRGDVQAILAEIEEAESEGIESHLGEGSLERGTEELTVSRERWNDAYGIIFSLDYSPIYHFGSQDGPDNDSLNQGLDFYLRWGDAIRLDNYRGSLDVLLVHRKDDFLSTTTQQFIDSRMSITAPNDANVEGVFNSISHLTWESIILEDRLDITVGQFYVPGVIDQNDILGNDRSSFMAEALSTNPARVIPNALSGMGIGSWFMPNDRFYLGGLVTQAEASGTRLDFDRFNGNWAYMAEVGWTPSFSSWGQGNYRLSYSRIDATGAADDAESSSRGLNISVDQEVGPYLSFAFRFGDNDGKRNDVKRSMSAAVIFKHVRGFDQDELGLAVFRTEPANKDQNVEDGLEAFWRFQLTNSTQLSPSIQLLRPSGAPSRNLESVISIRLMIML